MAPVDDKLPDLGDGAGGKGRLRDRTTGRRSGGGDKGRHSYIVRPLGGTLTGGGLGVSPH